MGLCENINLQSNKSSDLVSTCNVIYGLLLQHQKDIKFKDQLKQELQKARLDVQTAEKDRSKLEARLGAKEREIGGITNKARAGDEARREEVTRLRRENEDLQKRNMGYERRVVQMQHEIKRKEKDYERLQERLSHYLADKRRSDTAALDMAGKLSQGLASGAIGAGALGINASMSSSQQQQLSRTQRSDEGLKAVVAAYESKQAELARENKDLKSALSSLQAEYKTAINASMARREADTAGSGPTVDESFLRAVPHMSADELRAELSSRMKTIQQRLSGLDWRPATSSSNSVAEQKMLADLSTARSVIRDQEALILSVLSALRQAQSAAEVQHQADIKSLVEKYQKQLAIAEEEIVLVQQRAEEQLAGELRIAQMDSDARYESAMKKVDAALARAEQAEKSQHASENARRQAVEDAKHAAETKMQSELAKARAKLESDMALMAVESSELQLSLKKEQAALRAETGALRERLVAEKAQLDRAIAERDEALASVEAQIHAAEIRADQEAELKYRAVLGEKEARLEEAQKKLDTLDAQLAGVEKERSALEAQTDQVHADCEEAKHREACMAEELSRLKKELDCVRQEALDREYSLCQTKDSELLALKKSIQAERAALLSKAESDFAEERLALEKKVAVARSELEKYESMMSHYKQLMGKYAPGLGAGLFLERAVSQLAADAAGLALDTGIPAVRRA